MWVFWCQHFHEIFPLDGTPNVPFLVSDVPLAAIRRTDKLISGLPCRFETVWLSKALWVFCCCGGFPIGSNGTGVVTYIHLADFFMGFMLAKIPFFHGSCGFWHLSVLFLFVTCVKKTYNRSPCLYFPTPLQSGHILIFFVVGFLGRNFHTLSR